MSDRLIETFTLGAKTYTVLEVENEEAPWLGQCQCHLNRVEVQRKWKGKEIPSESKEQTYLHEVTHCILHEIGRVDLCEDETLVCSFSALLHQFLVTRKDSNDR